jgi:hypothetical protein
MRLITCLSQKVTMGVKLLKGQQRPSSGETAAPVK